MPDRQERPDSPDCGGDALGPDAAQLMAYRRRPARSGQPRGRAVDPSPSGGARDRGRPPAAWLWMHGRRLEVSDLDRVVFRGEDIRKGDVLCYYSRIGDVMLRHVRGRPLPCGPATGWSPHTGPDAELPAWLRTIELDTREGTQTHVIADEPASLLYLAERGCVTLHGGVSRAEAPGRPDCLLFDLDPAGPGASEWAAVCEAARLIRGLLERLGLVPFVMTTGSRGLHVRVPILPELGSESAIPFSRYVVESVVGLAPDRLAGPAAGEECRGGATVAFRSVYTSAPVAPYALRSRPGAPVATPLEWDEINASEGPPSCNISSIHGRLGSKGDPWADMESSSRSLADALVKVAHQPVERSRDTTAHE